MRRTVATSGRTVAFSATLLVIALAGLLVFPIDFLRSLAYGGMSAVAIAALVSVTLLPAVLGVLGHRVDKLSVPWRRHAHGGLRGCCAGCPAAVLRGRSRSRVPIVAVLLLLGAPFLSVKFGAADEKQLPPGDPDPPGGRDDQHRTSPAAATTRPRSCCAARPTGRRRAVPGACRPGARA